MNIKKDFLILTRNVKLKNKSGSVALNTTFKFPRWAIITMTFLYHPPELFSLLFFRKYIAIFYGCLRPRHIKQKPEHIAPAFTNPRALPTLAWGCPHTTIGPRRLNGRVRNGTGCFPPQYRHPGKLEGSLETA